MRWVTIAAATMLVGTGAYLPEAAASPEPAWSSYLGGPDGENGRGVAVDSAGNVYAVGSTHSTDWVSGGWMTELEAAGHPAASSGFLVKLGPDGQHLWSTYIGRRGAFDVAWAVAVDAEDSVIVVGETTEPTWASGGWMDESRSGESGFAAKFTPDGEHLWSTYIGGEGLDQALGTAVDAEGNVYVVGVTAAGEWVSDGWTTGWNQQWTHAGFVVKLTSDGQHAWSSYIGGDEGRTRANAVATGPDGNVFVGGRMTAGDWIEDDVVMGDDLADTAGFVVKLAPDGEHQWSAFFGGDSYEEVHGLGADGEGNVIAAGQTESGGWVSGGWTVTPPEGFRRAGFALKLDHGGAHLWSTYLGGSSVDWALDAAVDCSGNTFVTGRTANEEWGISGGWETDLPGAPNMGGFLVKLDPEGSHIWSSYLGGELNDTANAVAVDPSGRTPVVAGHTWSSDWISGGWNTEFSGGPMAPDAFVLRVRSGVAGSGWVVH